MQGEQNETDADGDATKVPCSVLSPRLKAISPPRTKTERGPPH